MALQHIRRGTRRPTPRTRVLLAAILPAMAWVLIACGPLSPQDSSTSQNNAPENNASGNNASGNHTAPDSSHAANRWQHLSWIDSDTLDEISGLARSTRTPDLFWAHNDSGSGAYLYAVDHQGRTRGRVTALGVGNRDWEDLAAFRWRGRHWLMVGDVGDNHSQHASLRLHLLPEPVLPTREELAAQQEAHLPAMRINPQITYYVQFPDGARDCESLAVDPRREEILLLSKRDVPARLYRIPLTLQPPGGVLTAEFIGTADPIPQPGPAAIKKDPFTGQWSSQPTALDLAPDGSSAAVLTYHAVYLFNRRPEQSWNEALRTSPRIIPLPQLRQAEALTYDGPQRIVVSSEKLPSPLYALLLSDVDS